jgi:hypothetical protein
MKFKYFFIAVLTFLCFNDILAQSKSFIIGADANYNLPLGTLSERLKGAFGGIVYAGKKVSDSWTWTGKLEYFKLTKVNKDKRFKTIEAEIGGEISSYTFPLPNLKMDLTVAGLLAEAKYNLLKTEIFTTDVNIGFGFYFWEHFRSSYFDSLKVDTSGSGNFVLVEELKVPSLRQKDWSGGINLGVDFNVLLFDPLWMNLSGNYKLIIGELWPTLELNLENVSGLQFIDFRAGIRLNL